MVDISGKLPANIIAILARLVDAARNVGIPLFIVGATARDILLKHAYGLEPSRLTLDIDVAIRVRDWGHVDRFSDALTRSDEFQPTKLGYRFVRRTGETLDILPFGPIAGPTAHFEWPISEGFVLSVTGFEEAFAAATQVILSHNPYIELPVCSLAGLAMLKLLSWNEARSGRSKDAEDFVYIAMHYVDADNDTRVLTDTPGGSTSGTLNMELGGAWLLGHDIGQLSGPSLREKVIGILSREADPGGSLALISDSARRRISWEESIDGTLALIRSVLGGIRNG